MSPSVVSDADSPNYTKNTNLLSVMSDFLLLYVTKCYKCYKSVTFTIPISRSLRLISHYNPLKLFTVTFGGYTERSVVRFMSKTKVIQNV